MPRMPTPKIGRGDAPIQDKYHRQMNAIAAALDQVFNGDKRGEDRETGFVLLVFPFADEGRCNYISNAGDRRDIIAAMKELIARFEGQPDIVGHG